MLSGHHPLVRNRQSQQVKFQDRVSIERILLKTAVWFSLAELVESIIGIENSCNKLSISDLFKNFINTVNPAQ